MVEGKIRNLDMFVLVCFLVISAIFIKRFTARSNKSYLSNQGFEVYGKPYDYSFTHECLESPVKPQYGGGIVENPEMNEGLKGWSLFGGNYGKLVLRKSKDGNNFIVTFDRHASNQSLSQNIHLKKGNYYTISAWLRLSDGESDVSALFNTSTGIQPAGSTIARSGCWSMLKGGLFAQTSGPAQLFFENKPASVELWADSISVQPFTPQDWTTHQTQSMNKARKNEVRFQAMDSHGQPLANVNVTIKQLRANFPFGCAISSYILNNPDYQNWFFSRFKYTVFENEMKWYSTEKSLRHENYSVSDAMLKLVQQHGIQVRGHNVFWNDPKGNPSWVKQLTGSQLQQAANKRINSVMTRYKGQLIHWDVVNENVHFSFFEESLGNPVASAKYYRQANQIDGKATPFLNEYNTIEQPSDKDRSPATYIKRIKQIRSQGYMGPLGIGLEGHFADPNMAYLRSGLDSLASLKLPIWITELDVSNRPTQAAALEQIIREVIAHPAVDGIILWSALSPKGCYRMCLTEQNFKNLATGDVIDKILGELKHEGMVGVTDGDGYFKASLYYGEYDFHFSHPNAVINPSIVEGVKVGSTAEEGNSRVMKIVV